MEFYIKAVEMNNILCRALCMMKINGEVETVYNNNAEYWAGFMRAKGSSANRFLEMPAMHSMLPNLKEKSVLCLGCGSGDECKHLKSLGAKRVVGIDISDDLLKIAKNRCRNIEFYKMPMEDMQFKKNSFDFIYSSLAMHYVEDWEPVFDKAYSTLKKGGTFLFSTHHPMAFCGYIKRGIKTTKLLGYEYSQKKGTYKIFGDYFKNRVIQDEWFGWMKIKYFHRPFKDMMGPIIKSNFKILEVCEPILILQAKKIDPSHYYRHSKIPLFIIFLLQKS